MRGRHALVLKGTVDIQGLVAIRYDTGAQCVYLVWGCTAPQNNVWKYGKQKYIGVGGHLFAIAAELSVKHGYDGFVYGDAMDREIYQYYVGRVPNISIVLCCLMMRHKKSGRYMIVCGVTNAFESDKIANVFIKKNEHNIYSGGFMEPFDVRGYARFIKEHQLSAKDITPEIMQKFVK